MYLIKTKFNISNIEGKGVFTDQVIHKNEVVWKFVEGHDKTLSINDYNTLNQNEKDYMDKVAYVSSTSNQYVFPPENDPALYTNHDSLKNNLSIVIDLSISTEPFFIANKNITQGEEITNNYHEFDEAIKLKKITPDWLR